jgi:hypothetical protein
MGYSPELVSGNLYLYGRYFIAAVNRKVLEQLAVTFGPPLIYTWRNMTCYDF